MTNQMKTVALLTAHAGKAPELKALLEGMIEPSRSEPGNLRYDLWLDQADENRFVLDELYTDAAAVAAHRASAHFQHYLSKIGDLADRMSVGLEPIAVRQD